MSEQNSEKLYGLCYGPYRDGQNPMAGPHPTGKQVLEDIRHLSRITKRIRTYSTQGALQNIDLIAKRFQIKVNLGINVENTKNSGANKLEIFNALKIVKRDRLDLPEHAEMEHKVSFSIENITVGNETVINAGNWNPNAKDTDISFLIDIIRDIKKDTSLPISTAEPWYLWKNYPQLEKEVDFITVHIYPFWDNIPIDNAACYVLEKYEQIRQMYPEKNVVIGETGWPTDGQADSTTPLASADNAKKFWCDFMDISVLRNSEYYAFEAFDECWKSESNSPNPVGRHWGMAESSGVIKDSHRWLFERLSVTHETRSGKKWRLSELQ